MENCIFLSGKAILVCSCFVLLSEVWQMQKTKQKVVDTLGSLYLFKDLDLDLVSLLKIYYTAVRHTRI